MRARVCVCVCVCVCVGVCKDRKHKDIFAKARSLYLSFTFTKAEFGD